MKKNHLFLAAAVSAFVLGMTGCANTTSNQTSTGTSSVTEEQSIRDTEEVSDTQSASETNDESVTQSASDADENTYSSDTETMTVKCDGSAAYLLDPESLDPDYDGSYFLTKWFGDGSVESMKDAAIEAIEDGRITLDGEVLPAGSSDEALESFDRLNSALCVKGTLIKVTSTNGAATLEITQPQE